MKSYHLLNILPSTIFCWMGILHLQKMGWSFYSIDSHPIESCCLWDLCNPMTKSILIISHFNFGSSVLYAKPSGLWFSTLTCWQFGHLAINFAMPFFIQFNQYTSLKSRYIFVEPGWVEYLDIWSSSMILSWSPSTIGTQNLLWYLHTSSPLCSKVNIFFLWTFAFNSRKIRS